MWFHQKVGFFGAFGMRKIFMVTFTSDDPWILQVDVEKTMVTIINQL